MGFDFGMRHIGIAIGQEVTASASPLTSIKAKDGIPNWEDIDILIEQWQPDVLVVGLPLNMDGSPQQMTFNARKFSNRLKERTKIATETFDERLSTADAKERLFAQGGYKNLKKNKIDSGSAALILESWMTAQWDD